jgi:hypothetical protein
MSTPLRAVYRGGSTSYNYNYGGELLANRGGFELLPSNYPPTSVPGSGTITYPDPLFVGNTISGFASCAGGLISWYRVDTSTGNRSLITQGSSSYTTVSGDIGSAVEAEVGCPDPSSPTGFGTNGSAGITSVVQPPPQVIFITSRSIGFPGAIDVANFGWATFMNTYAISFRTSNANGATDSSSAFFTALSPGTYTVIATADDSGTLVVNGQSCAVGAFFIAPLQTYVTISAAGPVPVTIEIINGIASPSFSLNPMGIAFTIEGPI